MYKILNDPNSSYYKNACKRTQNMNQKLIRTRRYNLINNLKLVGSINDIQNHLQDSTRNLVHSFFKYTNDKCDYCGIRKTKKIQFDRAHCNKFGCDRKSLLTKAINQNYKDEKTPVLLRSILRDFIKAHTGVPLFILCKECHREYDSKYDII